MYFLTRYQNAESLNDYPSTFICQRDAKLSESSPNYGFKWEYIICAEGYQTEEGIGYKNIIIENIDSITNARIECRGGKQYAAQVAILHINGKQFTMALPQIKGIDIRLLIRSSDEHPPVVKFDIVKFIKKVDYDKYYRADYIGFEGVDRPGLCRDTGRTRLAFNGYIRNIWGYSKEGLSNATISLDNSLFPMESSYNSENKLPYFYTYNFDTYMNFSRIGDAYLTFAPVSSKTEEIYIYAETLALINYNEGELIFAGKSI